MKILYDYQGLMQHHGGVSRYHVELIKNLRKLGVECDVPFILSDNVYLDEADIHHVNPFSWWNSGLKKNGMKWVSQKSSLVSLVKGDYDIFHPTFLNPYYIGYAKGKPVIPTMHDLNHEKFPQFDSEIVKTKRKKVLDDASHIIAISQQTKHDLMEYYYVKEDKITVVYHGIDQDIYTTNAPRIILKPYLLYVGGRNFYKNFKMFLKGFSLIKEDIDLVCTGVPFNTEELALIHELKLEKKIRQMFVTNEQMCQLMAQAVAFVYPSIAEGFGMPILEAYRCGCPCIISDILCFHEVAGDAAKYFNPKSKDDIAEVISKTITDSDVLNQMKINSIERMKHFSWERTARETLNVYEKLLNL